MIPAGPHATEKQINFIEILREDLGFSLQSRNLHISHIVGKHWKNDIWALSRSEASLVIDKFKKWKENKANEKELSRSSRHDF